MPDLITFAKGVNSGYVPAGGVIISDAIASEFDDQVFPGGLTYSGHPLAMASIVASIDAMDDEGIVENAATIGREVLGPGLLELADAASHDRRGARPRRVLGARPGDGSPRPASPSPPRRWAAEGRAARARTAALRRRTTASTSCRRARSRPSRSRRALAIYDEAFTAVEGR